MKSPFKRDATAALARALKAKEADEAKVAELLEERQRIILSSDNLDEVRAINLRLEDLRRTLAAHSDRVAGRRTECRKQAKEEREQKAAAAIEVIAEKLAVRERKAAKLEAAIKAMGELYFDLISSATVETDWPFTAPRPNFGRIDSDGIYREVGWALFSAGRPIRGETTLPSPNNIGLGVTGIRPRGIAGLVAEHSRELLRTLHSAPLGDDDPETELAAVAS